MVLKHHLQSDGFGQQVKSWSNNLKKHNAEWSVFFFFMRSCSCLEVLWLLRGGVFGFWMAGKMWQEWVLGLCGIPTVSHISNVSSPRPTSCSVHLFTLDGCVFTREDSMNKEQFNQRVSPLFSIPPLARREKKKEEWKEKGGEENERKRRGRKIMWKKLQWNRGMFDIHLGCEGRVQSQMCAFLW